MVASQLGAHIRRPKSDTDLHFGLYYPLKTMFIFKIYDVTYWTTNNYNTCWPISQEVKATRQ